MPSYMNTLTIVKKHTRKLKRNQYETAIRVGESWRHHKGIDSCVRRKFRGKVHMPNIGYGSNKKTRHMFPNGFYKLFVHNVVHNVGEIDMLLIKNRPYCAEIAHNVLNGKSVETLDRAAQIDIKVTNAGARIKTEDTE